MRPAERRPVRRHPARVLVVDDEPPLTDLLADLLEDEGYLVERAYDGDEALAKIRGATLPDLVLSDVMMPGLSGTALLMAARGEGRTRRLPFVLLSAGARPHLDEALVRFQPKPLALDGLLACIEELLEAAAPRRPNRGTGSSGQAEPHRDGVDAARAPARARREA